MIAILDAGGQYAKVIDRRVRELGVHSVILPLNTSIEELNAFQAIIITGGPQSVFSYVVGIDFPDLSQLTVPILGICFGMQLLAHANGGKVETKTIREDGVFEISVDTTCSLFAGLEQKQQVLLTHGDTVEVPGSDFNPIAWSGDLLAGMAHKTKPWFGVQFHPEVDLTKNGREMFANFLFEVAKVTPNYQIEDREELAIAHIKERVGDSHVLVLVSGGVDSSVAAALVSKAIEPDRIQALHIDHGFMRSQESDQVIQALESLGLNIRHCKAHAEFATATTNLKNGETSPQLHQVTDPEMKRTIIGDTFMNVAEREIAALNLPADSVFLVQGTLRPDLIESASGMVSKKAAVIKTHHNDTHLVRVLRDKGRVVEPLAEYHKDEVRILGEQLGLPKELVWRHPFPGPGLAIRILCATEPYFGKSQESFLELAARLDQEYGTDDYAVTALPIRSVGIQGDGRSYSYVAAVSLRKTGAADSISEKTRVIDWLLLFKLAKTIPQKEHDINRVVFGFGPQLPQEITSVTPTFLTQDVVKQLQQADDLVQKELMQNELHTKVSQVPVISIPLGIETQGNRSIVIRTIITNDFMTGVPAVPDETFPSSILLDLAESIAQNVPGISRAFYDLTAKPPGTTEWE